MYFFGNLYVTIFAWIILICVSTWLGHFLREACRDGQAKVIKEEEVFWYLVVCFIVGFPCLIAVIEGISSWFNW
jgi:hypothetical protein